MVSTIQAMGVKNKTIARILFSLLMLPSLAFGDDLSFYKGFYRITYDNIEMPGSEKMGLVGLNYLLDMDHDFYAGFGVYGAVRGERGGFFTGGIEAGKKFPLTGRAALDAGVFMGGGGGSAAPQGGGLMVRPHAGILYDLGPSRIGLSYSKVKFPNGKIDSDHISLHLEIPFESICAEDFEGPDLAGALSDLSLQRGVSIGWRNHYFAATLQRYHPSGVVRNPRSRLNDKDISLVGFEYGKYMGKHIYGFIETAGAVSGAVDGYAEILAGAAYDHPLTESGLGAKAKISVGSAGGGQVDTGGGIVFKGGAALYYSPSEELTLEGGVGYVNAPEGRFEAEILRLSINYNIEFASMNGGPGSTDGFARARLGQWDIGISNQTYLSSETIRKDGESDDPVQLMGVKANRFLTGELYITGQALGAYDGDVGGYAVGLLGLGYNRQIGEKISLFAELSVGAAGGGGVAVGGGGIYQPMAGLRYAIIKDLSLQASAGRVTAFEGGLDATVVDLGIVHHFQTIETGIQRHASY